MLAELKFTKILLPTSKTTPLHLVFYNTYHVYAQMKRG